MKGYVRGLFVTCCAIATLFGSHAQAESQIRPWFGPGEVVAYDLKWEFIKGGEAEIAVSHNETSDSLWDIRARAWSTGIVDVFYTVRDTITSTINANDLWPVRFEKKQREGSYHRDSTYVFEARGDSVIIHRNNGASFACSVRVHDILSVMYRVRTYPLEVGRSFETMVYEGGKFYSARVDVLRREQITVPAGTFDTVVAEPILESDAIFKQKGRLWIWFTDDERRIPVRMASQVPIGRILADLTRYVPPDDSSHR